jgi:hypothetical protein
MSSNEKVEVLWPSKGTIVTKMRRLMSKYLSELAEFLL